MIRQFVVRLSLGKPSSAMVADKSIATPTRVCEAEALTIRSGAWFIVGFG
jgi:hypothetical protein